MAWRRPLPKDTSRGEAVVLHALPWLLFSLHLPFVQCSALAFRAFDCEAFDFGNTALTVIERVEGDGSRWRASLLACTAHLDTATANDANAISGI